MQAVNSNITTQPPRQGTCIEYRHELAALVLAPACKAAFAHFQIIEIELHTKMRGRGDVNNARLRCSFKSWAHGLRKGCIAQMVEREGTLMAFCCFLPAVVNGTSIVDEQIDMRMLSHNLRAGLCSFFHEREVGRNKADAGVTGLCAQYLGHAAATLGIAGYTDNAPSGTGKAAHKLKAYARSSTGYNGNSRGDFFLHHG